MKRWPFGSFEMLKEEAGSEAAAGGGGVEKEITSYKVNGKDVPIETLSAALNLHSALADETLGKEIIGTLAQRMGLLNKDGEVKNPAQAEAKLEGRVQKMLKAKFGKEYEKFADTLGPVMDDAIKEYLDEMRESRDGEAAASGWEGETEKFLDTHTLTEDIETKMESLIKRGGGVPRGLKGKAAQEYLTDMYELAVKKLGIELPDNESRRSTRNRRDRNDDVPDFREEVRPKGPLSLDQIVDAAMRGVRFRS